VDRFFDGSLETGQLSDVPLEATLVKNQNKSDRIIYTRVLNIRDAE
jgi:hypothetical protein